MLAVLRERYVNHILRNVIAMEHLAEAGILKFLHQRVAKLDDPRSIGKALHGSRLGEFWKYRVGNYRLICKIEDHRLIVLVLRVGHRKEIYP